MCAYNYSFRLGVRTNVYTSSFARGSLVKIDVAHVAVNRHVDIHKSLRACLGSSKPSTRQHDIAFVLDSAIQARAHGNNCRMGLITPSVFHMGRRGRLLRRNAMKYDVMGCSDVQA